MLVISALFNQMVLQYVSLRYVAMVSDNLWKNVIMVTKMAVSVVKLSMVICVSKML